MPAAQRNKNAHEIYIKYNGPKKPPEDAVLLTVREAAYLLRCSTKTVMEYASRKKNPAPVVFLSKRFPRFPREALIRWAQPQTKGNGQCIA